jgi:maltose-binding protein MalE
MIPYVFEARCFGLPGTQNFWVTYYRKDILESIGITEIPQTWDEIIEILPLLQSYGMNYYVPLGQFSQDLNLMLQPYHSFINLVAIYIHQMVCKLQSIANKHLRGIRLMSELYTLYNMPKFVGNFYNHFRYGLLPIGISDLSTYLLLANSSS